MPRFAVLEHDHPERHWDFLLEHGDAARTWRLPAPPQPGQLLPATPLPDHRKLYLDYEGPVSRNRGTVKQWDAGTFTTVVWSGQRVEVELNGWRLRGRCVLCLETSSGRWTLSLQQSTSGPPD